MDDTGLVEEIILWDDERESVLNNYRRVLEDKI